MSCAYATDETSTGAVPTRILTAWGDEDTITYHGGNFAKGQVFLYGGAENSDYDPIAKVSSQAGISFFDVMAVSQPWERALRLFYPQILWSRSVYGCIWLFVLTTIER